MCHSRVTCTTTSNVFLLDAHILYIYIYTHVKESNNFLLQRIYKRNYFYNSLWRKMRINCLCASYLFLVPSSTYISCINQMLLDYRLFIICEGECVTENARCWIDFNGVISSRLNFWTNFVIFMFIHLIACDLNRFFFIVLNCKFKRTIYVFIV